MPFITSMRREEKIKMKFSKKEIFEDEDMVVMMPMRPSMPLNENLIIKEKIPV